jgi:hypothetical protein
MPDQKKNRGQPLAVERAEFARDIGDGWRTEKVTVETRGIRESVSVQYFDKTGKLDLHRTAAHARLNSDHIDRYGLLFRRANEFLKARGEKDYLEALRDFSPEFEDGEPPPIEPGSFGLLLWVSGIGERRGVVSAEAMAARFLMLADAICMRAGGDEKQLQEVFAFARAWHEWQSEVDGEHSRALHGINARKNLRKAAQARTGAKRERLLIVAEEAQNLWREKSNYRSNGDATAQYILHSVNEKIKEKGLRPYTIKTLIKVVGEVLNPKPKRP